MKILICTRNSKGALGYCGAVRINRKRGTRVRQKPPPRNPEDELTLFSQAIPSHRLDRKSTRLNSSHVSISYAVFCLKKKKNNNLIHVAGDLFDRLMPQPNHLDRGREAFQVS